MKKWGTLGVVLAATIGMITWALSDERLTLEEQEAISEEVSN
jgi:hypothetical protein